MLLGSYCEIVLFASYYKLCIVDDGAETSDTLKLLKQPLSNPERPRILTVRLHQTYTIYYQIRYVFSRISLHAILQGTIYIALHLLAFKVFPFIIFLLATSHSEQHLTETMLDI